MLDAGTVLTENEGADAMTVAARRGHIELIKLLLSRGAKKDAPLREGLPVQVAIIALEVGRAPRGTRRESTARCCCLPGTFSPHALSQR